MAKMDLLKMFTTGAASVAGGLDTTQQDIDDVKKAAITYVGVTVGLQVLATASAVVIAIIAVKNYNRQRKTLFNGGSR